MPEPARTFYFHQTPEPLAQSLHCSHVQYKTDCLQTHDGVLDSQLINLAMQCQPIRCLQHLLYLIHHNYFNPSRISSWRSDRRCAIHISRLRHHLAFSSPISENFAVAPHRISNTQYKTPCRSRSLRVNLPQNQSYMKSYINRTR